LAERLGNNSSVAIFVVIALALVRRSSVRKRLIIIIALSVIAAYLYLGRYGSTPPFRDMSGSVVKGSVAEMQRLKLGGVEQSITIRGRNANAPILIWLHGGPGTDETGMWRKYNNVLEDHFLVVYWTQRGTGRSYSSNIPASSMTIAQFVSDLDQLISFMQRRFGKQKVVLAGHSWGTSFGVAYAQRHPQNLAAFVGVSQVVNATAGEKLSYHFTLNEAKRRGDSKALRELSALGEPPYALASIIMQRKWLEAFGGGSFHKPTSLINLMWQSFGASEMTLLDGIYFQSGIDFSGKALAKENAGVDWWSNATKFDMPVFIASGRFDYNTPAGLQEAWFDRIEAPVKTHRWFEHSAHSPPFEEPDKFNRFMIDEVLPLAQKQRLAGRN
jgi:proline iminopeptidase